MSNKHFFLSLLVNAKCGGGRRPAAGAALRQPAGGRRGAKSRTVRYFAWTFEQPGRRPARDCVKRRTAAGPVCVTAIGRSVITYFCLCALGRKRRGKCWWSDGRDRQIRIFRCSKRHFRLRLYRNIPLSAALCSCKRVRLSDFLRKFAERIFPLWPFDSCKRGQYLLHCLATTPWLISPSINPMAWAEFTSVGVTFLCTCTFTFRTEKGLETRHPGSRLWYVTRRWKGSH